MVRWAGGVVRLLVKRCRCEGMVIMLIHHDISLTYGGAGPSPLWFPMKNLRFKFGEKDPTLSVIQRMIWSVVRLITMRMLASVAGRDLQWGERKGVALAG